MMTTASVREGARRRLTADTVVELVQRQAERHPEAVAVRHGGHALTYGRLLSAAAGMAATLADDHGVAAGLRVGLATRRGIPQMVSVLAILMAGGCYVPLDPALPAERLRGMIDDAGLKLLVSDDAYAGPRPPGAVIAAPQLPPENGETGKNEANAGAGPGPGQVRPGPSSEAYVLFTSGSTGRPKGVVMPHRPLVNLIEWQRASSTAGVGTRTLQFAPIGFDVSFQEIFSTWCTGGELVLIGEQDRRDPARVLDLAHRHQVQRIFVPFAVLQSMSDWAFDGGQALPRLQEIITAGEQPIVTPALERFVELTGSPTLANQYGPTETHAATQSVLRGSPKDWPRVPPLGEVLDNCSVLLLDDSLTPVPEGTEGEICIAGVSLADGYAVDDDRTRGRFVDATHLDGVQRLYRTGDFGIVEDGVLLYRGRRDDQVKISGHRIEMGEVEAAVSAHPEVGQVAVVPVGDGPGTRHLVAFVVPRHGTTPDEDGLRAFTALLLPAYAVPRRFLPAEALPRTATNKVDRRALAARAAPAPPAPAPAGDDVRPRGARETVRAVWQRILGTAVPDGAQFFGVGGDSLTAVRLVVELNKHFERKISVGDLLLRPGFEECVAHFEATGTTDVFRPPTPAGRVERGAWLPVALTQAHRMNREAWRARHGLPSISNVPMAYHLEGPLDATALETALRNFVVRHPALALEIDETPGAHRQRLTDWAPTLRRVRLDPQLPAEATRKQALALVQEDAERSFVRHGTGYDGLLRATLIQVADREHHLFLCADHIVFDGWSVGVLNEDLAACYRAALHGAAPPAAEPDLTFLDWARAEHAWLGEELAATLRADFGRQPRVPEDPAAALLFPAIEPGPPAHYAQETLIRRRLDADRTATVHGLAQATGHPMGSVLTALYATAFARWSGRDPVALVSTFANRTIPDADRSVGFFANNVPVFLGRAAGLSPAEMIDRTARQVGRAAQREAVPFPFWLATLLPGHEDLAGSARYAFLNVRSQDRSGLDRLELDGVTSRAVRVDIKLTPSFALGLRAGDNGDDIALELAFLPGLVAPDRAEALMAELEDVVDRAGHPRGTADPARHPRGGESR